MFLAPLSRSRSRLRKKMRSWSRLRKKTRSRSRNKISRLPNPNNIIMKSLNLNIIMKSLNLSIHYLSITLIKYLFVCLSVCLFVYLSVWLTIRCLGGWWGVLLLLVHLRRLRRGGRGRRGVPWGREAGSLEATGRWVRENTHKKSVFF